MLKYAIRRTLIMIPVLLGVTVVISSLVYVAPGNPARIALGQGASPEAVAQLEAEMGLNQPPHIRYIDWLFGVLQGDLGTSIQSGRAVNTLIMERLPATLELALIAMVITLLIALPLGIVSAIHQYSWIDNTSMLFAIFWLSMPSFWLGLMLIYLFAVHWQIFPVSGRQGALLSLTWWSFMLLPAIATGTRRAGLLTRLTRSAMLEVLGEEYVQTARGKGIGSRKVVMKHGVKNAMIPVVTLIGLQVPLLFSGTVIIEEVFSWPGMGRMLVRAVEQRDYPVVQGAVLVYSVIVLASNLAVDLTYSFIDPRVEYE